MINQCSIPAFCLFYLVLDVNQNNVIDETESSTGWGFINAHGFVILF
jgi:hypothetical protein